MVYKATLKRRVGIEVFDNEKALKPEEPGQVVAVKELQGDSHHHGKSCIKGQIVTHLVFCNQTTSCISPLKVTLRTTQLNHFSL